MPRLFAAPILWFSLLLCFRADGLISTLAKGIEEGKVYTLENFIETLPRSALSTYSLVFDSKNRAQFASPDAPRILLSENNLHVAFTGLDTVKGAHLVEIAEYDSSTDQYTTGKLLLSSSPDKASRLILNPKECAECHGNPFRPIVWQYRSWLGWYGGRHSQIAQIPENSREADLYKSFLSKNKTKGRYRFLQDLTLGQLAKNNSALTGNTHRTLSGMNQRRLVELLSRQPSLRLAALFSLSFLGEQFTEDDYFFALIPGISEKQKEVFIQSRLEVQQSHSDYYRVYGQAFEECHGYGARMDTRDYSTIVSRLHFLTKAASGESSYSLETWFPTKLGTPNFSAPETNFDTGRGHHFRWLGEALSAHYKTAVPPLLDIFANIDALRNSGGVPISERLPEFESALKAALKLNPSSCGKQLAAE